MRYAAIMLPILTISCVSRGVPDTRAQAEHLVELLRSRDFISIALALDYPESYTAAERKTDAANVAAAIRLLSDAFGQFANTVEPASRPDYVDILISGGDIPYWMRFADHIPTRREFFETTFENYGRGFVIVGFVATGDAVFTHSLGFGLPPRDPQTRGRLTTIVRDLGKLREARHGLNESGFPAELERLLGEAFDEIE